MKYRIFNILLIIGLSTLLFGASYFGYRVHTLSTEQRHIKEDFSTINSITFGIFSVDQWRDRISDVINPQVSGYSITPKQKRDLLIAVEKQLHALVDKTVASIDKPQKTLGGKLKKMAFHALVDSDALQAQVKPFAKTIVGKLTSPASQARLKNIATSKLNQLENQTYDNTSEADAQVTKHLYQKYQVSTPDQLHEKLHNRLAVIWKETIEDAFYMLACVLAALLLWWFMRKQVRLQTVLFVMSLLFAGVLLLVGLTSSVIEVDARMQSFSFELLDKKVEFTNQVLFFQSKSIWGIITTLIDQSKPDTIAVGLLILIFVIALPVIRLVAKGVHISASKSIAENKVVNYLAFESGKWDMADVMIVGTLMTYIGLNGILKSQLADLNIHNDLLNATTVNNTSLQPGYFIFAGYVAFEMLLSYILKKITPYQIHPRSKRWTARIRRPVEK